MKKKNLLRIVLTIGGGLMVVSLLLLYSLFFCPNILVGRSSAQQLHIPHNIHFSTLQATLQQQGYLSDARSFRWLARLLRYDRRIRPGVYQLQPNMSNWESIRLLRAGNQLPVKVVLNNINSKADLARQLTKNLEVSADEVEKLLHDPVFLQQYDFQPETVSAMFIPNTYEVYWTISAQGLFRKMHKEYQRFWNETRRSQAKSIQLTPIEVSTLASIVQKETNKKDEAPLIAGVYLNRLKKKMALGSCPTLLYILNDPTARRVLNKYKNIDSPYNTYKYRGLPPGPICSPSITMIDAVLNYTSHSYLYFSAKEDFSGYHYFSQSYQEHLRNAKRYRQALNRQRIYR